MLRLSKCFRLMNLIRKSWWLPAMLLTAGFLHAAAQPAPDADAARQQAIAGFTQRMKDANYPALFDKAAQEFNVPPDVLKGVAFAETRWSNLQWPPGETVSPENGMPRPYGIMSLMDNEYFGHSLITAATLIGEDPDILKTDVYQNMRGGAALLRKLYDETPKPADAQGDEIESWRNAIVKYCGIPQPELSESHALHVYEFMSQGYHQYGIDWNAHPVNLGPIRAEVAKIRSDARTRVETKINPQETPEPDAVTLPRSAQSPPPASATTAAHESANSSENLQQRPFLLGLIFLLLGIGLVYVLRRKYRSA